MSTFIKMTMVQEQNNKLNWDDDNLLQVNMRRQVQITICVKHVVCCETGFVLGMKSVQHRCLTCFAARLRDQLHVFVACITVADCPTSRGL